MTTDAHGQITPAGVFPASPASLPSSMALTLPAGSDAAPGPYRCSSCGYPLQVVVAQQLAPCWCCHGRFWELVDDHTKPDPYGRAGTDGWTWTSSGFEER